MANTVSFGSFQEQLLSLRKYEEENAQDNREKLDQIIRLIKPAMENELNEKQRDMMQKYYFSGMTMQEISDIYGINRSTVSRYLARSRRKLEKVLRYTFLC